MLDRAVVDALFPSDLPEPSFWEEQYPPRGLGEGAKVTRLGPSPTGFLHIGGLYVGMIDRDIASHSGGSYIVRVEDTDQAREVAGAVEQFDRAFEYFGIQPDEAGSVGAYGPYHQSQREQIYLTYVRELLRSGDAYLCFATKEELADITARQQATKLPTGYYGRWAIWRDKTASEVAEALEAGRPYVVRFRSPGKAGERTKFVDAIRGELEHEANRNDVVILKASDQSPRLPTYHFAHAVDDHLMRVNLVIRGEEWISSVPTHLQLFDALGFERVEYAHIAPLMKQQGGSRRKLSKRKDPEASVEFFIEAGYPAEAVQYYMRGLVNARLAELPLAEALAAPISLAECGVAGPLVDLVKLEDISADYVATLSGAEIISRVSAWAASHDPELVSVLESSRDEALAALQVERGPEVANPRKDLRKWSDFRTAYGFFFSSLFSLVTDRSDERLGGLPADLIAAFAADFADGYVDAEDGQEWFGQIRELATKHGFAPNPKEFKKNPDAYPGSIKEAAQLIRVALTGSNRSPDLHAVARTLGKHEVLRRVRALA
ncbi:glutamyl-tRNA synthetase [Lentzea aerocolonigenes]|uniref:Glutamyl-tRNA synthetase n=1 Tax=Lentzea aerocolonigenes TaxID=68170 RepID=A0A0F0GL17_LENAE|nr:glutamate--tRNA ligase family protein [Lentzea aerocolonigenes]KJK42118.1 glutamyl-tRNA synthetase [Lentzea aerocolonigenes]